MTDRMVFWRNVCVIGALVLAGALAYLLWPGFADGLRKIVILMSHGDVAGLKAYLSSFGTWAPAISTLAMILQAVVLPLPAFLVALVNGLLFGVFWGSLLTWSTALVGAAVCFYLGRALGKPAVERLLGNKASARMDAFFHRYGTNSVLIARLIPFVSFSAVGYVAGMVDIRFWSYMWATAVGILPAVLFFCVLGQTMTDWPRFALYAVTGTAALAVIGFTLRHRLARAGAASRLSSANEEGIRGTDEADGNRTAGDSGHA